MALIVAGVAFGVVAGLQLGYADNFDARCGQPDHNHNYNPPVLAVLGDMLELGENSISLHKDVLQKAEELRIAKLILVGELYAESAEILTKADFALAADWSDALAILKDSVLPESTILIKGSNSINLGKLVEQIQREGI